MGLNNIHELGTVCHIDVGNSDYVITKVMLAECRNRGIEIVTKGIDLPEEKGIDFSKVLTKDLELPTLTDFDVPISRRKRLKTTEK